MATINVGSLYSQMQLDISGFRTAAHQAENIIEHLRNQLRLLTNQSKKALGQVIAPTITPGKIPFFQPAAPAPTPPIIPTVAPIPPQILPTITPTITPGKLPFFQPVAPAITPQIAPAVSAFAQLQAAGQRAWQNLSTGILGFNAHMGRLESRLINFRTMFLAYAGMRFLGGIVEDIAEFDKALAAVRAVINNVTREEMTALQEKFRQIGATSVMSASEAAQGGEVLARAGMQTADILAAINPIMDLAIAGQTSFKEAADFTISTLFAYNMAASETGRVSDIIAFAANESRADVTGMGLALSYAASTAKSLNIPLETTAAALATLSQQGLRTTTTGTGLRGVLASLVAPTQKARDALKTMGLSATEVNPRFHSLIDIFTLLQQKGFSAAEAFQIFPRQTANAALALANGLPFFQSMVGQMGAIEGSAKATALAVSNNLAASFKQLHNVLIEASLQMGDAGFLATLRGMTDGLTNALRALLGFLNPLAPGAAQAYALSAAIQALTVALTTLIGLRLGGALLAFAIANPIVVGIAAVTAALVGLYSLMTSENKRFEDLQANVNRLLADLARISSESSAVHIQNLRNQANETIRLMKIEIQRLKNLGESVTFREQLGGVAEIAGNAVTTVGTALDTFDKKLGDAMTTIGGAALKKLDQNLPGVGKLLGLTGDAASKAATAVANLGVQEAKTARATRLATMEQQVAAIEAGVAAAPKVIPAPLKSPPAVGEPGEEIDKAGLREANAARREAFQTAKQEIQALAQAQREKLELSRAEQNIALELLKQGQDAVGLAMAEGQFKLANLATEQASLDAQIAKAKAMQAMPGLKPHELADVTGDVAKLEIQRQQLGIQTQLVILQSQSAVLEAQRRQEAERLAHSYQMATSAMQGSLSILQAQGQTATTLMEQHNALVLRGLELRGASEDETALVRYQQQVALAQTRYDIELKIYNLRVAMVNAELQNLQAQQALVLPEQERLRIAAELLRKQYELQALQAAPPIQQQTLQPLTEQQRAMAAFPSQMAQSLSQGVQALFTAFSQGGAKIGEAIQGMGKTILDTALKPLMAQVTDSIQKLISGLGNIGPWAGAAIGLAMTAIGSLFSQEEASVEALGENVKGNIESVERTRGLIAGDQSIQIQQLSENLSMAFRPTNDILLRIEALVRMAAGIAGASVPSSAYSTYAGELIGSVRLG